VADRPTVVVVGAASRDLDATDPLSWRLGGGVTYSSMAAARLGLNVRAVVGVDGEAATSHELDVLRDAGVDVRLAPIDHGPVFDNRQTPAGRVQFSDGPSDSIPVAALPTDWRAPTAAILAPVAGELDADWASVFNLGTTLAIGLQGFVRKLDPGAQVEPLPLTRNSLVERAQMLLVSAEDSVGGTTPMIELLDPQQELVVTHGAAGALHVQGTAKRYIPALPKRDPVDPTGAGDVFLGAWVAARLLTANAEPWRSLVAASTMASLSVQARTIAEFPTTSEFCDVLVRLRDRHRD
jgi:sugar/nucleoside kinase (ribokinase family)